MEVIRQTDIGKNAHNCRYIADMCKDKARYGITLPYFCALITGHFCAFMGHYRIMEKRDAEMNKKLWQAVNFGVSICALLISICALVLR